MNVKGKRFPFWYRRQESGYNIHTPSASSIFRRLLLETNTPTFVYVLFARIKDSFMWEEKYSFVYGLKEIFNSETLSSAIQTPSTL